MSASNAINSLNQTVNSFQNRVNVKVQNVHTATNNIQATTDQIYDKISKFKTDMLHGEEKQIAQENIMRIDQIIKEQFGNHEAIRKTIIGVVRDFDINLVRNSTIQELSEELWITSSRYWLSYALIAVTAWVNNYPEVAKNALAESGRKDAVKTTLFFCLTNLRFNRVEAAKLWFYEYFKTLDPTMLQQETAVLLQAFLNGIFGRDKELEGEVMKVLDEWIAIISDNVQICDELISAYESYIGNMHVSSKFGYQSILQFCSNYTEVQKSFEDASKYDILLAFVEELNVPSEEQNDFNYKDRIDAILINLISRYDEEELDLKNQQEYYRMLVDSEGVVEQAENQYQDMLRLQNENFNIGRQMIKWAIYDDSEQTDIQVRKFGFQNTKNWFKSAVDNWSARMQEAFPLEYFLSIDTWTGTSNGRDHEEQLMALKQYYENSKFQNMYINNLNIAAAIVFVISLALVFVTPYSLVATVLAAAFLGFRVFKAMKEYPLRVNAAIENLNHVMAELAEFRQFYEDNRLKKDKLLNNVEFI